MASKLVENTRDSMRNPIFQAFEKVAKDAVSQAIAIQRAKGLPTYSSKNGKLLGRAPNGRFVSPSK